MTIFSIFIIVAMLTLNFYLYKKKFINKNLFYISTGFILLYSLISILIFYNNISNGYSTGILFGDIANNHFCDEYKYNIDSQILLNHWKNGEFTQWLNKELPVFEFVDPQNHPSYGNYNAFVIILAFLRLIGITSILDFILLKLFVYIPTYIYLYKLSKIYLNEKLSLLSVILFSILPGYLLTNAVLMRDNIIIFLIIAIVYYILSKNYNFKLLVPLFVILLFLRSYLILIFIATLVFTYKNSKRIITILDIIYLLVIISTIYFFTTYSFGMDQGNIFFSFYQIQYLQDNFTNWYGYGVSMLIRFFTLTLVHVFSNPLFINFLSTGILYLIIFSLGNILSTLLSVCFGLKFLFLCFKKNNCKLITLIKFTFYFTLLNGLLVMAKDSYIINRIELMWIPLFIIILLVPINNKT